MKLKSLKCHKIKSNKDLSKKNQFVKQQGANTKTKKSSWISHPFCVSIHIYKT